MNYGGIDSSLTGTGIVVVRGSKVLASTLLETKKSEDREYDDQQRLEFLVQSTIRFLSDFDEEDILVGIENHAFGMQHGDTRPHELGGIIKLELWRRGIPFVLKAVSSIKLFGAGHGRATKQQMSEAAIADGFAPGRNHNLADAYFVAKLTQSEG